MKEARDWVLEYTQSGAFDCVGSIDDAEEIVKQIQLDAQQRPELEELQLMRIDIKSCDKSSTIWNYNGKGYWLKYSDVERILKSCKQQAVPDGGLLDCLRVIERECDEAIGNKDRTQHMKDWMSAYESGANRLYGDYRKQAEQR